jgi:2-phosphoglycerate kinase
MQKPRIILINGAPGIGKSTVGLELAYQLGIKQIVDVDVIREVLRGQFSPDEKPYLHKSSCSAWKVTGEETKENIIASFLKYCEALKPSIERILNRADVLGKDMILEGVHLVPSMYAKYLEDNRTDHFLIYGEECEAHKNNFYSRESEFNGRSVQRFLNQFDNMRLINDYLQEDARLNNSTIISNTGLEETIKKIREVVL